MENKDLIDKNLLYNYLCINKYYMIFCEIEYLPCLSKYFKLGRTIC